MDSRERAVNDLQLLTPEQAWQRFHEFEFWSQLVLKTFFAADGTGKATTIRPKRRIADSSIVLIAGEIGTGKTTLAELLRNELGFSAVSTRACVADILGLPDFAGGDRTHFQQAAATLVSTDDGIRMLSRQIADAASHATRPIVIDGVRHRRTIDSLREYFPDLIVLFIDATRDDAYRNYVSATGRRASLAEFRIARAHPVEREVATLKHEADVYIFNGGSPADMLTAFQPWWTGKSEVQ